MNIHANIRNNFEVTVKMNYQNDFSFVLQIVLTSFPMTCLLCHSSTMETKKSPTILPDSLRTKIASLIMFFFFEVILEYPFMLNLNLFLSYNLYSGHLTPATNEGALQPANLAL